MSKPPGTCFFNLHSLPCFYLIPLLGQLERSLILPGQCASHNRSSPYLRFVMPLSPAPFQTMYPPPDGSLFALSTIPDMALLAVGHYDYNRYQPKSSDILSTPAESTWCAEPSDSTSLLSESLRCSHEAQPSLLSEPEGQSPMTVDGSTHLSPPGSKFKSRPPSPAGSSVRSRATLPPI